MSIHFSGGGCVVLPRSPLPWGIQPTSVMAPGTCEFSAPGYSGICSGEVVGMAGRRQKQGRAPGPCLQAQTHLEWISAVFSCLASIPISFGNRLPKFLFCLFPALNPHTFLGVDPRFQRWLCRPSLANQSTALPWAESMAPGETEDLIRARSEAFPC